MMYLVIYLFNLFVRVFSPSLSFVLPAYLSSSCPLIYLLNKKVWDFRAIVFSFGILGISSTWMVGVKHGEMWQTMWVYATPPHATANQLAKMAHIIVWIASLSLRSQAMIHQVLEVLTSSDKYHTGLWCHTYDSDPCPYLMGQPKLTILHTIWGQRTRPTYQQITHWWWLGQIGARLPMMGAPIQN